MSERTIVAAEACLFLRPAPVVMKTSYHAKIPLQPHVIVRLRDEAGREGFGEASPLPGFTGETGDSILLQLRKQFLPLVPGLASTDTGPLHRRLAVLPGNTSAKAAIDMAFHDLAGKALGLTVTEYLGGAQRDSVATNFPIGICAPDEAVAAAEGAVVRGLRSIKMKVGLDLDEDVARVSAVHHAMGEGVTISIDANRGYTLPAFLRLAARLEHVGLDHAEQPLAEWDIDGLAAIRKQAGLRIMADESLHTLRDAQRLIGAGAVDILGIKLIKTGGLTEARAIAALAAAHHIEVSVISPFETQIGAAAGLALALSVPKAAAVHGLRVFDSQPDMARTEIRCKRGQVTPAFAPGLGVEAIPELEKARWQDGRAKCGRSTRWRKDAS